MKGSVLLLALLLLVMPSVSADNSCVNCHSNASTILALQYWQQDYYAIWYASAHGIKNVTCDRCHGGDGTRGEKSLAHLGMRNSSDPASPIYYKNLPETCRACHVDIYEAFVKSKHYKNLEENKLAPTCTTCHGLHMGIGKANPLEIAEKCKICHNPEMGVRPGIPAEAKDALLLSRQAEVAILRAHAYVDLVRERGKEAIAADKELDAAQEAVARSRVQWHSLDLGQFRKTITAASDSAEKAGAAAKDLFLGPRPTTQAPPATTAGAPPPTAKPPSKVCGPTVLALIALTPLLLRRRGRL